MFIIIWWWWWWWVGGVQVSASPRFYTKPIWAPRGISAFNRVCRCKNCMRSVFRRRPFTSSNICHVASWPDGLRAFVLKPWVWQIVRREWAAPIGHYWLSITRFQRRNAYSALSSIWLQMGPSLIHWTSCCIEEDLKLEVETMNSLGKCLLTL